MKDDVYRDKILTDCGREKLRTQRIIASSTLFYVSW